MPLLRKSTALAALVLFATACGESSPVTEPTSVETVPIVDENNYRATSSLSIPTIETASGQDLDICWDALDADIQCHDVAPAADIDVVGLLRLLHLTEDEVEQKLAADDLQQNEVDGYVEHITDHEALCTKLSALSFFGTTVEIEEEYVENDDRTYMLLFSKGTVPGVGARTMTFIKPTAASDNLTVNIAPGCGHLTFEADLGSGTPLALPAAAPWVVDWRGVTKNGLGNPVPTAGIDRALVGYYPGMTVEDLEADIFNLELNATELFEITLQGSRTADLSRGVERNSGEEFSGFARDEEGVWLFGLTCSTCKNPAPVVLTILAPEVEGT